MEIIKKVFCIIKNFIFNDGWNVKQKEEPEEKLNFGVLGNYNKKYLEEVNVNGEVLGIETNFTTLCDNIIYKYTERNEYQEFRKKFFEDLQEINNEYIKYKIVMDKINKK